MRHSLGRAIYAFLILIAVQFLFVAVVAFFLVSFPLFCLLPFSPFFSIYLLVPYERVFWKEKKNVDVIQEVVIRLFFSTLFSFFLHSDTF